LAREAVEGGGRELDAVRWYIEDDRERHRARECIGFAPVRLRAHAERYDRRLVGEPAPDQCVREVDVGLVQVASREADALDHDLGAAGDGPARDGGVGVWGVSLGYFEAVFRGWVGVILGVFGGVLGVFWWVFGACFWGCLGGVWWCFGWTLFSQKMLKSFCDWEAKLCYPLKFESNLRHQNLESI
jgi:hypothetical protein